MSMLERSLEKTVELGSEWLYETKFSGPQAEAAMERVASQHIPRLDLAEPLFLEIR